jgi:asparagine N-glycosylation enzyme membrane subunit Stt3
VEGDLVTPVWILDVLAALMLAVAAVSAARVAAVSAVRGWRHEAVIADTDVAHLLMAVAMAGMLAPGLGIRPGVGWEIVFALLAVWFAVRVLADAGRDGLRALAVGHRAPHLVHSGSMLYMFLAASRPAARASGLPGGPGGGTMALSHPTLAYVFALVLVGYAIWDLDQLSGRRRAIGTRVSLAGAGGIGAAGMSGPAGGGFLRSPAVTVSCRIAMGITMAFMLLIAL